MLVLTFDRGGVRTSDYQSRVGSNPLAAVSIAAIDSQDLDIAVIRCQRLLVRLMRFSITAKFVPWKDLVVADALSRTRHDNMDTLSTETDVRVLVEAVLESIPAKNSSKQDGETPATGNSYQVCQARL